MEAGDLMLVAEVRGNSPALSIVRILGECGRGLASAETLNQSNKPRLNRMIQVCYNYKMSEEDATLFLLQRQND